MLRSTHHVAVTNQVRLHVGGGIFDAVADARLRSKVDDAVEIVARRHFVQRLGIGEIDLFEPEAIVEAARQPLEPPPLQGRIVIIVEVVDSDDLVTALKQYTRRRRADEPGGTSHQYLHGARLLMLDRRLGRRAK